MLDPDVDLVVVVVVEVNHGGVRGSVVVVVVVVMPIRQPNPPTTNVRQPAASGTNNTCEAKNGDDNVDDRRRGEALRSAAALQLFSRLLPTLFSSNPVTEVSAHGPSSELCREQLCTKSEQWKREWKLQWRCYDCLVNCDNNVHK